MLFKNDWKKNLLVENVTKVGFGKFTRLDVAFLVWAAAGQGGLRSEVPKTKRVGKRKTEQILWSHFGGC